MQNKILYTKSIIRRASVFGSWICSLFQLLPHSFLSKHLHRYHEGLILELLLYIFSSLLHLLYVLTKLKLFNNNITKKYEK